MKKDLVLTVAATPINVLITGGGAPGAAGIIHCLRQDNHIHITAVDVNAESAGRLLADDFATIPLATDPAFIPSLLELCKQKNIQFLLPLVTKELLPLSQNAEAFRAIGTTVIISPAASLEIANDKSRLYQFLQWRGIAVPDFRVVETVEQFETAAKELGYPSKPFCFKPSVANGSRGFRVIDNSVDEHHLLFNEKPNSTYIAYEKAINILSAKPFPELLVSELLPGDEISVDCLANQGETLIALPRLRKKMINGISVAGEFLEEKNIIHYCTQIIHALQLHGNIGIQVKQAANGEYLILEINPRVQGTIAAALGAGINLPLLAIRQQAGLPMSPNELKIKWGTKFVRHWSELFYDK